MFSRKFWFFVVACFLLIPSLAQADDPWAPDQGELSVFGSVLFETFDEFYRGSTKADLPFGELDQYTYSIGGTYGIRDDLALDVVLGYTTTEGKALGEEEGLNDTTIGLRWKFVDEFEHDSDLTPSLALGTKLIVPGSYSEDGFPIAPGDAAWGAEFALLFGKIFADGGLGAYGEVGVRIREEPVPDDFIFNAGLYKSFADKVSLSAEYRMDRALSGIDLGTPEFSPPRAQELKQITQTLEFGLGYTDPSGWYLGILYGFTIDGRNTGDKDIYGASFSIPLT